ncbi:MAG: hypothetical protein FD129_7 [bacterium]|nr:MAG: hypothetical protein FD129_7 [bacterium]
MDHPGLVGRWSALNQPATFKDGVTYSLFVRARDKAGNWVNNVVAPGGSGASQTRAFHYDVTRPTGSVTAPANFSSTKTLASFSGLWQDTGSLDTGPSGLEAVYVAVEHVAGPQAAANRWWDWAAGNFGLTSPPPSTLPDAGWAFVSSRAVSDNQTSLTWSTPVPAGMMSSSNTYRVVTLVLDHASNKQPNPTGAGVGATFRFDNQAPLPGITFPLSNGNYNTAALVNIAGIADDGTTGAAGLAQVEILLKSNQLDGYWNGASSNSLGDWDTVDATKRGRWQTVTGLKNWTKAVPSMAFLDSTRFTVWVRARDLADNVSATPSNAQLDAAQNADSSPAIQFTFDDSKPLSRVYLPVVYANTPTLAAISGTSSDPGAASAGVTTMEFKLKRSNGDWWSPLNDWAVPPEPAFSNVTSGLGAWTKTIGVGNKLENGYRYEATGRATDAAGNVETVLTTHTFTVDLTTPVARIALPAHNGSANASLTQIQGTADDRKCALPAESEVGCPGAAASNFQSGLSSASIEVAIQESSGAYWVGGGSTFTASVPVWSTATFVGDSSGVWTWAFSALNLVSPRQYKVSTRARYDRAGNFQVVYATNAFIYDTTKPDSLATAPTGPQGAVNAITGTAKDEAPGSLAVVTLSIKEETCAGNPCHVGEYWNGVGAGWKGTEFFLASGTIAGEVAGIDGNENGTCDPGETCAWSFDSTGVAWDNKSDYSIVARARDQGGNVKDMPGSRELTFYLETPAPVVNVAQPPLVGGLPQYQSNNVNINTILGTGSNLRTTDGVRIALRRLTSPTSYWFDPSALWSNDASTYTSRDPAAGAPQNWSRAMSGPYTQTNSSYSMTITGVNSANQLSVPPVTREFIVDDQKPTGQFISPAAVPCPGEPSVGACLNVLPAIVGTAIDPGNPAGVAATITDVWIRIKDNQDVVNPFWNGAAFQPAATDIVTSTNATSVINWSSTTLAGPSLRDGVDYTLFMFGKDRAGNQEGVPALMQQFTFAWDVSPPTAWLIQPSSGQVYMNLDTITGTAVDPPGASAPMKSGVTSVKVRVRRPSDNSCFDGAAFGSCSGSSDLTVTGTDPWQYTNAALTGQLASGATYVVTVQAADAAGNPQAGFTPVISSRTVHIDKAPPTVGFTKPVHTAAYQPSVLAGGSGLTGTASDAEAFLYSGDPILATGVHTLIWYLDGGTSYYFNSAACTPSNFCSTTTPGASWSTATWSGSWELFFNAANWVSDKRYRAQVRARDRARVSTGTVVGNLSVPGAVGQDYVDFTVDGTPPETAVKSHANGAFIQNLAAVFGTANSDLAGAASYYLRITTKAAGSPEAYWNGAVWTMNPTNLPVEVVGTTGTVAWTYPGNILGQSAPSIIEADGVQYGLSFQAKDFAGQISAAATNYVILDRIGPSVSITTPMAAPNDYYGPARALALLRGNSSDSPAGVDRVLVQIRNLDDGSFWHVGTSGWVVASSSYAVANATAPWTFTGPAFINNKRYTVSVVGVDNAGNPTAVPVDRDLYYDANKPSSTILSPNTAFQPRNFPTLISGTALDVVNLSAETTGYIERVELAIQETVSGNYWKGTVGLGGFSSGQTYRVTSSTPGGTPGVMVPWSYPAFGDTIPPWADGVNYTIKSRAVDRSQNVEPLEPSFSFTYDQTAPTTTVSVPAIGGYVQTVSTITGPFSEGFGLARVQVAVQRQDDKFWDGTGFNVTANPTPVPWYDAQVWESTWSYFDADFAAAFALQPGIVQYVIWVAGTDAAGNINRSTQTFWLAAGGGDSDFYIDPFRPVSVATSPPTQYHTGAVTPIVGTAIDRDANGNPAGAGMMTGSAMALKVMRVDSAGTLGFNNGLGGWVGSDQGFNLGVQYFNGGFPAAVMGNWASAAATLPEAAFLEGYEYRVASRGRDLSTPPNFEASVTTRVFIVDRSTPTTAINSPTAVIYVSTNGLTFSSGTHVEPFTGGNVVSSVSLVELQLEDVSAAPHTLPGSVFWTGHTGTWMGSTATTASLFTSSWSVSTLPTDWTHANSCAGTCADGRRYALRSRAKDRANNQGVFPSAQTASALVIVDVTPPVSGIVFPAVADGGIATSLTSITGTAADVAVNSSSAGVSRVFVSIKGVSGGVTCSQNLFWQQSSGQFVDNAGSPIWNAAAFNPATGEWTFSSATIDPKLGVNCDYVVTSRADDKPGLIQAAAQGVGQSARRQWLFQPPPSVTDIGYPTGIHYRQMTPFTGTINANTYKLELQIERADTGQCWGGELSMGWVNCLVDVATAVRRGNLGSGVWGYPGGSDALPPLIDNTTFTVSIRGLNIADIPEVPTGWAHAVQYRVDRTSPTSTVGFPSAGFVSVYPTLTGAVNDPLNTGVQAGIVPADGAQVRIRRSNGDSWNQTLATWVLTPDFNAAAYNQPGNSWSFAAVPGSVTWTTNEIYQIFVRGEDQSAGTVDGNIEDVGAPKATFIYDTAIPTATITSLVRGSTYSVVTVSGTVSDSAPGVLDYAELFIKDHGTPGSPFIQFWNGTAWTSLVSTRASVTGTDWVYGSLPTFQDQHFYAIWSTARDRAGNVQSQSNFMVNGSSFTFYVDVATPVVSFTNPPGSDFFSNNMGVVTGGVTDPAAGINAGVHDVQNVKVQVKFVVGPTTFYYDNGGNFFSACPTCNETDSWFNPRSGNFTPITPSQGNWVYDNGNIATTWVPDRTYVISARGIDDASPVPNEAAADPLRRTNIVYDITAPAVAATGPADKAPRKTVVLASGTVTDNYAGVQTVRLVLSYLDGPTTYYWNTGVVPSSFTTAYADQAAVVAVPGALSTTWSYDTSVITQLNDGTIAGREFRMFPYVQDRSGNWYVGAATTTFYIDNTKPSAAVTKPPLGALTYSLNKYYSPAVTGGETWGNPLDPIRGTAADTAYPAGYQTARPSLVEVRVKRSDDDNYWTGAGWTAVANTWLTMEGTTTWTWNAPPAVSTPTAWNDNQKMTVDVRAVDLVGNVSNLTFEEFNWDSAPPVTTITAPTGAYMASVPTVAGYSNDPLDVSETGQGGLDSSVKAVQVGIRNNSLLPQGRWWDGSAFTLLDSAHAAGSGWFSATVGVENSTADWTHATSTVAFVTGNAFSINARSIDYANNVSAPVASFTFVFDNQKPNALVVVPPVGAGLVISQLGTIQGTASDGVLLDRVEVRLKRNDAVDLFWDPGNYNAVDLLKFIRGEGDAGAWFPATGTSLWSTGTFPSNFFKNSQSYSVHARSIDKAGNVSSLSAATFTFTTDLPTSFINIPSTRAISVWPNIGGTAVDLNAAVSTVSVAVKRLTDSSWYNDAGFVLPGTTDPLWRQVTASGVNCSAGPNIPCSFSYTLLASGVLTSGLEYQVMSISSNSANKVEQFGAGNPGTGRDFTFVWDTQPPVSKLTFPLSGDTYPAIAGITGTVADQNPGAGLHDPVTLATFKSSMTVSIKELGPLSGAYWNGAATFTLTTEQFFPVDSLTHTGGNQYTWALNTGLPTFANGRTYRIRVRGTDAALPVANQETALDQRDFNFESSEASATITVPIDLDARNSLGTISGTAADLFGVRSASISLRISTGNFWDGSSYLSAGPLWYTATLTDTGDGENFTWSYSSTTFNFGDDVNYTIGIRVQNRAGVQKVGQSVGFTGRHRDRPGHAKGHAGQRQRRPGEGQGPGRGGFRQVLGRRRIQRDDRGLAAYESERRAAERLHQDDRPAPHQQAVDRRHLRDRGARHRPRDERPKHLARALHLHLRPRGADGLFEHAYQRRPVVLDPLQILLAVALLGAGEHPRHGQRRPERQVRPVPGPQPVRQLLEPGQRPLGEQPGPVDRGDGQRQRPRLLPVAGVDGAFLHDREQPALRGQRPRRRLRRQRADLFDGDLRLRRRQAGVPLLERRQRLDAGDAGLHLPPSRSSCGGSRTTSAGTAWAASASPAPSSRPTT